MSDLLNQVVEHPEIVSKLNADELLVVLEEAHDAYHASGIPLMPDDLYDVMKQRFRKLNPKHPFLKRVGAPVKGEKVTLPYYMGSLDKIRDDPKHVELFKKKYPGKYVVSDKLDGVSALLVYEKGTFTMYTRGDGVHGQNVTSLGVKMTSTIPKASTIKESLVVRGEIIMSKASWELLKHKGSNPRNVVAGTVNAKTPDMEIVKHLQLVAYEILHPKELPSQAFQHLERLGFKTPNHIIMTEAELNNDTLSNLLIKRRAQSEFECDGIVIRHDKEHKYITGKNPNYAFAYKSILTHEEAEVIVHSVEWNVSKDGFIKPTILFDTVVLGGVKIKRVSGFNGQFIEKNKIGPGSRVVIIRSGDVIPHIVRILSTSATGKPSMPDIPYEWTDTHVDIYIAGEDTEQMILKQMEFFVTQMDIKYLAKGTLAKLYKAGYTTIPKIMNITKEKLLKIEGIQEKGAQKLYDSIYSKKTSGTCIEFLNASNMLGRGIGLKKLEKLVAVYPDILEGKIPDEKTLLPVEGMSKDTVLETIRLLPQCYKWLMEIDASICTKKKTTPPIPDIPPEQQKHLSELKDKTIVFTGFRNKEWEESLKAVSCNVSSSVTKKTFMIVALDPEEKSGKLEKAKEYGIQILSKTDFQTKYRL